MIFMDEIKSIWVKDPADVPEGAERFDNSSKVIKCWKMGGNYYYYIQFLSFDPSEIDRSMGGDKIATI